MDALSKDEFRALMTKARADEPRTWLMMLLHFWHGGRNSEIIHLRRDNFVGTSILFDRGKGSEACKQKLVAHADPLFDERSAVFAFIRNLHGKQRLFPVSRWTYWRRMKRLALAAGVDPLKAKTTVLKHSLCTYMYENVGANLVQRRAGHKAGSSTLVYGKVQESAVDAVITEAVGVL
jgi:integrase